MLVEAGNTSKTNDQSLLTTNVLSSKPKLEAKKKVYSIEANVSLPPDLKAESEVGGDPADAARQERLRKQKEKQVCVSPLSLSLNWVCTL